MKFDGQFISKNDPNSQLENWMEKIVEKSILTPQNLQKEHLIQTYEALGITVDTDVDGPMKLPDIRDIDFGDTAVKEAIAYLYNIGIKNNWIDPASPPLRSEQARFTGEHQRKVREVFDNSNYRMMSYIYGENWRKSHIMVDEVLVNDVWALTHNDLLLRTQRRNAYELLTGGEGHNTTVANATNILDIVNKHLMTRERPKVTKGDRDVDDYGEIDAFIGTLHRAVSSLNPDRAKKHSATMTQEEAKALMELVKDTTGNLFTDTKLAKDFDKFH